jgi:hypothetical protein
MDSIRYEAFWDEMQKIGYSIEHIGRTLARSKGLIQKLPPSHSLMAIGPAAYPRTIVGTAGPSIRAAILSGQIPEVTGKRMLGSLDQIKGKITMPQHGGAVGYLGRADLPTQGMTGDAKRATEALVRAHEMDEMGLAAKSPKGGRSLFTAVTGHLHPDVILREHNRLTTLPKDVQQPVQSIFHKMRPVEGSLLENSTRRGTQLGLNFGRGPRLSRHARRRVSERMERLLETMQ